MSKEQAPRTGIRARAGLIMAGALAAIGLGRNKLSEVDKAAEEKHRIGEKLHHIGGRYSAPSRYRGGKHRGRNPGAFGQSAGQKVDNLKRRTIRP